jgi:hypothetical protein
VKRSKVQVTFDCADPPALADFWARALGYPPPDTEKLHAQFRADGEPEENLDNWSLIFDPAGEGPHLFFQKVPEAKVAKNRIHLDIKAADLGLDDRRSEIDRHVDMLLELGATKMREVQDNLSYFVVMQDPEGNEFCID